MYDELLRSVDNIDMDAIDSEINVLESLIDSYDKALTILENCDDSTDISSFEIFQEGERWDKFKADADAPIFGTKDESLAKRIAMVIPRLIAAIIRLCKKLFSKNKKITERMKSDVKEMKQSIDIPVQTQPASTLDEKQTSDDKEQPEEKPEIKSNPEEDEINQALDSLKNNAQTSRSSTGEVYKMIPSILFGHDSTGSIDRLFLEKGWFVDCEKSLVQEFDKEINVVNLQSHINKISTLSGALKQAYQDLQVRHYNGGTAIRIKDSEFVAKMEEFARMNEADINACNALIKFVEEKIDKLGVIKSQQTGEEEAKLVTQLLRQYSRFLKMLNVYVTTIWQAWEHDRGARDQARVIST